MVTKQIYCNHLIKTKQIVCYLFLVLKFNCNVNIFFVLKKRTELKPSAIEIFSPILVHIFVND